MSSLPDPEILVIVLNHAKNSVFTTEITNKINNSDYGVLCYYFNLK